jgi:IclR family transcriptional regulator, pca regulon regulatory protein
VHTKPGLDHVAAEVLSRKSRHCSEVWNMLRSGLVTSTASTRQATWSQSLERGLAILSAFGTDRSTIGVSELSRELGLSRSTTHRYIATLTSLGYLQQDAETKRYRLGPRVLDLGFAAINSMDIREISVPHLQALSDSTGFTVNMAILDGPDVVYIERCRTSRAGQREIDLNLHVGSRLPAYCTAMGKALLAFVPADRLEEILDETELTARGPNTITDRAGLRAEMERIRAAGVAVNNEELAYGLRSIAAPIRSRSGEVVAALNLAVHRSMVSIEDLIERHGPPVKRTAEAISAELGHRAPL